MSNKLSIKIRPTKKQEVCWASLRDNTKKFVLFGGGAGGGKVVPKGDSILTPFGFKKIEDLNVGTLINNPDGSVCKVVKLHPWHNYEKWKISFIDGTELTTTGGHLWNAWKCSKSRKIKNKNICGEDSAEVIETRGMLDWINRGYNVAVPVNEEQPFNVTFRKRVQLDPYHLGLFLGDGHISKKNLSITSADHEHMKRVFPIDGYTLNGYSYWFKGKLKKQLVSGFDKLGLLGKKSNNKFIPKQFKYASIRDRYSLIQGLMDTDGYISKDGKMYYTTISSELAEDTAFVIRSLGGVVSITKKKGEYKKDGVFIRCNDCYELYISYRNSQKFFRLERKLSRSKGNKTICKRVKSIEIIGGDTFEGRCITVSHPNGLYITNNFIVTHNSWLGCEWVILMCLMYPGAKMFIGRNELKRLMASTFITFLKVTTHHGIPKTMWKLNSQYNFIQFTNGSRIDLLDVSYQPRDPLYERFGSTEYSSGWLEEVGEIKEKAFDVLKSRIGRHQTPKMVQDGFKSMMFLTCNPKKNWVYHQAYKPWKEHCLPPEWVFIQSLYTDNPYTASEYGENLRSIKDPVLRERLMLGNWEYENDDAILIKYENILDMFGREYDVESMGGDFYLSVDVARFGRDKAVIMLWQGWYIRKIWFYDKSSADFLEDKITSKVNQYHIEWNNVVIDEDGVGGGVVDHLRGCTGFVNNSTAVEEFYEDTQDTKMYNYRNLRSQCYYKLAEVINEGKIGISKDLPVDIKNGIIEELECVKRKDVEKNETTLAIIGKDEMKEMIGRSPDFADSMMMRCYFGLGEVENFDICVEW